MKTTKQGISKTHQFKNHKIETRGVHLAPFKLENEQEYLNRLTVAMFEIAFDLTTALPIFNVHGIDIEWVNVPNRTTNPDGTFGFFRVSKHNV